MFGLPLRSYKKQLKLQSGQALIIVLLVLSVVLATVLSAVSKSITDVSITSTEADSLRAFSAAEAGVEQALFTGTAVSQTTLPGGATYVAPLISSDAGRNFVYPADLLSGEVATIWFVSHDANGNLTCASGTTCYDHQSLDVYWGQSGSTEVPAIVFTVYSDPNVPAALNPSNSFANVKITRFAYDPSSTGVTTNFDSSGVSTGTYTVGARQFKYRASENLNPSVVGCNPNTEGCLLLVKFKLLNTTQPQPVGVIVQNGRSLPPQGVRIDSVGKAGDVSRKVSVFQGYPAPLSLFDSAVFSRGDISK